MKILCSVLISLVLLSNSEVLNAQSKIDGMSLLQIYKEAEKENAPFQFTLGYYYESGKRLDKDSSKAKYWYERAIKNGYEIAKIRLACLYDEEKDYNNSYPLWLSYADNNLNEEKTVNNVYNLSLYKVALYKKEGRGTNVDIKGAIKYGEKARNNGYSSILGVLYGCYDVTEDNANSFRIAKEMYEKDGVPFFLAIHYLYGKGCEQNLPKVYNMLTNVAKGNLRFSLSDGSSVEYDKKRQPACQLYIGIANYFDKNKPNHYEESVRWLMSVRNSTIAQRKDKGEALCLLSRCYRFGRGVKQDVSKANELQVESKKILTEEEYNDFSKHFEASY